MAFWRKINPTGAIGDFITVFRQAGTNRWYFAGLAALTTFGVFSIMSGESWKKQRFLPDITYITSWPADRTEEETRAFIAENQRRKEQREELQRQYDEEGRKMWKAVGRASGLDVEAMEAKAKAEAAADKARAEAEAAKLIAPASEAPATPPAPAQPPAAPESPAVVP